jgi:Domain of unknown function (DUF1843)
MAKQVYGPDIMDAIASGDLARMKEALTRAEDHLQAHGRVAELFTALEIEIAKYEQRLRSQEPEGTHGQATD